MRAVICSITTAGAYAVADTVRPEPMFGPAFWTVIATSVLGYVWIAYKEARDRRWKKEDEAARAQHDKEARIGREAILERLNEGIGKVDENTELTKEGIRAANNYNEKIVSAHDTAVAAIEAVKANAGIDSTLKPGQMVSSPLPKST